MPPISTDRPSQGTSPDLVPKQSLQIEDGVGASMHEGRYTFDWPQNLIRWGATSRLEVNFLSSDEMYQPSTEPHTPSLQATDPVLGAKLGIGRANSFLPKSMVIGVSLPVGGKSWTSGSYDPNAVLAWTQTIQRGYYLNEIMGATLTTDGNARRPCWAPSLLGGRALSEAVGVFAEYAPTVFANRTSNYVLDGGFALVRRKLTQVDFRTGYMRDSDGFHTLLSFGYSFRIDGVLVR